MTAADRPAVRGGPLAWLGVEGVGLLIGGIALFTVTHQPWWLLPAVILLKSIQVRNSVDSSRIRARPEGSVAFGVAGQGPLIVCVPGMGELRAPIDSSRASWQQRGSGWR